MMVTRPHVPAGHAPFPEHTDNGTSNEDLDIALGIASGVVHDLGGLLTGVLGYIDLATAHSEASSEAAMRLTDAAELALRAARLAKGFAAYSRSVAVGSDAWAGAPGAQLADIGKAIRDALLIVRPALDKDTACRSTEPECPLFAPIASDDLVRILVNLLSNANLAVKARALKAGPTYQPAISVVARSAPPTREIVIEVSDNGTGMPPGTAVRVFTRHFTTRKSGEGLGLGLWVAHRIANHAGGEIKVETIEGVGTTFSIVLPMAPDSPDGCPAQSDNPRSGLTVPQLI